MRFPCLSRCGAILGFGYLSFLLFIFFSGYLQTTQRRKPKDSNTTGCQK
jgi:hypothetical protein